MAGPRLSLAEGVRLFRGRTSAALFDVRTDSVVDLNESAGVCLDLLGCGFTVDEAASALVTHRGLSSDQARAGIEAVRDEATQNHWLIPSTAADATPAHAVLARWEDSAGPFPELARWLTRPGITSTNVEHHVVHLLAQDLWVRCGGPASDRLNALAHQQPLALAFHHRALARVIATVSQPLVLLKGVEVAARYPLPILRGIGDIDVLAVDAEAAFEELVAAGWRPTRRDVPYGGHHHLNPLIEPESGVILEVHRRPTWPEELPPQPNQMLIGQPVEPASGVGGITAPDAAHLVLLMAAHSWKHRPFAILRDLVDVAVLLPEAEEAGVEEVARVLGVRRFWWMWRRAAEALLLGGRPAPALEPFVHHLRRLRTRDGASRYTQRGAGALAVGSPVRSVRLLGSELGKRILLTRNAAGTPS